MENETTNISTCCNAEVSENYAQENPNSLPWRCNKCDEPCAVTEVCAYCLGEGEYSTDESDGEGHIMRGVGTQKCHCTINEDEYDNQE